MKATSLKKGGLKEGSGNSGAKGLAATLVGYGMRVGESVPDGGETSAYIEGSGEILWSGWKYSLCLPSPATGGLGDGLNRLAIPDTTIPGWRPSNGASREMVPRIRCRKGDEVLYGCWLG